MFSALLAVAMAGNYLAFAQSAGDANAQTVTAIVRELQKHLDAEVAGNPGIPGELLHIISPKHKLDVSLASGVFDRETKRPLDPHHVFRVASVTKTFTAAAILRFYEDGKIKLDDPINRYLPQEYVSVLEEGEYATKTITVRHLLTHTSGIHDYAADPKYQMAALSNPKKHWTRMEQVQLAMKLNKPHFEPGKGFHYSDTGYVLLGEMIERLSGKSLGQAFRDLLDFKKLELDETYLETLEPAPVGIKELSHPYFGSMDTVNFDPSFDLYGGGGLVSSEEDLARFYRALLQGKVFRRPETLQEMLTIPETNERRMGAGYGMALQRGKLAGFVVWGHLGFWGTAAGHSPDLDLTIVRHLNQGQLGREFRLNALYEQIAETLKIRN
jgi:D-alanyl-D-alanine carboxypeptidase